MSRYHVIETPTALDQYKQASAELLAVLGRVVYPALWEDPTNERGRHPIRYRAGGFYSFEVETPEGGLHYLLYQAIEEIGRVLVFRLVTLREP
ncbi:MAG TPA: hypothetical protein VFA49_08620 [Chloroflexota bacterium]|nr:hypothetical protein [Chloroflexota bacterium]